MRLWVEAPGNVLRDLPVFLCRKQINLRVAWEVVLLVKEHSHLSENVLIQRPFRIFSQTGEKIGCMIHFRADIKSTEVTVEGLSGSENRFGDVHQEFDATPFMINV